TGIKPLKRTIPATAHQSRVTSVSVRRAELARLASAHARQLRRQTAAAPKAREGPRKVVLGAWSIAQPMPRAAPALAVAHMSSQAVDCNALEATTSIEEITDNEHNRDTLRSLQNDELPALWLCKPGMAIRWGDYEEFELGSSRELDWLRHFAKKSTRLEMVGISGGCIRQLQRTLRG
ncbi:hypothetical protein THAOC_27995, partial [Thalassiosira oceanica]